jgi:hypothetical protein
MGNHEGNLTGKPMVTCISHHCPQPINSTNLEGILPGLKKRYSHFRLAHGPKEYATADSALKLNALAEQTDGIFSFYRIGRTPHLA